MNNEDQLYKDNSFKKLQKNIRTGSSFLAHYYENTRLYTLWRGVFHLIFSHVF